MNLKLKVWRQKNANAKGGRVVACYHDYMRVVVVVVSSCAVLLLVGLAACSVPLEGLRCDDQHACVDGYSCVQGTCKKTSDLVACGDIDDCGVGEACVDRFCVAEGEGEGCNYLESDDSFDEVISTHNEHKKQEVACEHICEETE